MRSLGAAAPPLGPADTAHAAIADFHAIGPTARAHVIKLACGIPLLSARLAHARPRTIRPRGHSPFQILPGPPSLLAPQAPARACRLDKFLGSSPLLAPEPFRSARLLPGKPDPQSAPVSRDGLLCHSPPI